VRFRTACLLGVLALASCVTSSRGDKMESDITRLRERLDAMEVRDRDMTEKVAQLRKVLDQATALLGRNSADLGARVAKHEADLEAMTGKIEEAKHLLAELQKQVQQASTTVAGLASTQERIVNRVAPTIPDDKESLWREAQKRLSEGHREDGRRFLRAFIQRFPSDPRAPQAQLQVGITYVQELKHSNAVAEFSNLIQRFPKSAEVPEAMWQLAEAFVVLKFCGDAKAMYQDLARRYPRHPRASQAKKRMREVQKMRRNKNLCTS